MIKQVNIAKMSEREKEETLKEAEILEVLNHPNIVTFREFYKTKKGHLCIVMDFADGGDLAKMITNQRGKYFSESQIMDWFTLICLGALWCEAPGCNNGAQQNTSSNTARLHAPAHQSVSHNYDPTLMCALHTSR